MAPLKRVVYVEDSFDQADPTPAQFEAMKLAAADLGASGFDTVVLAGLHVRPGGALYYNDVPFSETLACLPPLVAAIKAPGVVTRVLVSIGPLSADYAAVQSNLPQFKAAFAGLAAGAGLDGIDFDLEEDYNRYADLLVDLTGWAAGLGLSVTAAPYQNPTFWAKVLRKTCGGPGRFAWWNLQTYGGADYGEWLSSLAGLVDDPASFLVPGYSVAFGATPDNLSGTLRDLRSTYPALAGSFVWQYELIKSNGFTAAAFASAIRQGLTPWSDE